MRGVGPVLLGALLLGGCAAPAASPDRTDAEHRQLALLSVTEGGGAQSDHPAYLDDPIALAAYVAPLSARLADRVRAVVTDADLADGERLAAAVVDIGCSPPDHVVVTGAGAGLRITGTGRPAAHIACPGPITTVAVVAVSAS